MTTINETIQNLTDLADDLCNANNISESIRLIQIIDRLHDVHPLIESPEKFIDLNIHLDNKFGRDILSWDINPNIVAKRG